MRYQWWKDDEWPSYPTYRRNPVNADDNLEEKLRLSIKLAEAKKLEEEIMSKANILEVRQGTGIKYDGEKLPLHLLPFDALEEIAIIFHHGTKKYSPRNWEKGLGWSRLFSALMRHMWAWYQKRGTDPETGKSHLAHAGCCILFLLAFELRGVGRDDRGVE